MKISSLTGPFEREGWITRDGKFLPCDITWGHGAVAMMALGGKDAESRAENLGWIRLSTYGENCSKPITQKQRDTLFDWTEAMGFEFDEALSTIAAGNALADVFDKGRE